MAQRGTEDDSDPGSQSPSDSEDQSPDPTPRPTDASAQPPDSEPQKQQMQQASVPPAPSQTQEVIADRLQQVAAAAAVVDPETAADIQADASPLVPGTARAAESKASFNSAFSASRSTALPEQGELLVGSGDVDVFNEAAVAATLDREQDTAYEGTEERAPEQPMQVAFSRSDAEALEPPTASDNVVIPTASTGPKASKGAKSSLTTLRKGASKIPGKEDILAQLEAQRAKQAEQLKVEAHARQELEDMLLRIERHFKAEQAARRKAEELLAKSTESEANLKGQLDAEVKKRSKEQKQLAAQREEVKSERAALDQMRAEFENELQQARGEMQRAQDALQGAEDQVSSNQQVERSKMEKDYQAQMATLSDELNRVRQELTSRTEVMGQEMERWRQTAEATSRAVTEAKNEVMERKRDLDMTKEKMDKLVDKLYLGREKGNELTGAIAHQLNQHHAMWKRDQGQGFIKQPQNPQHPHHSPGHLHQPSGHPQQPSGPPFNMHASSRAAYTGAEAQGGIADVKAASGKRGPPPNVAFGGSLISTKSRLQGAGLSGPQPASPLRARPRQVQPQAQSDGFLPAIKNNESSLKKQGTGYYPPGFKKGGTCSLQHQPSDRWAESKRDANMVAYAAKWQ